MKLYSFYDIVGDSITNVLLAKNDDMMLRQCQQLPEGVNGDHFVLLCVADISDDGHVTPEYRKICKLSQASEELEKRIALKEV